MLDRIIAKCDTRYHGFENHEYVTRYLHGTGDVYRFAIDSAHDELIPIERKHNDVWVFADDLIDRDVHVSAYRQVDEHNVHAFNFTLLNGYADPQCSFSELSLIRQPNLFFKTKAAKKVAAENNLNYKRIRSISRGDVYMSPGHHSIVKFEDVDEPFQIVDVMFDCSGSPEQRENLYYLDVVDSQSLTESNYIYTIHSDESLVETFANFIRRN